MVKDEDKPKNQLLNELKEMRKRAEETIRINEQQFRVLVSNIPGVVYRCAFDPVRTIHYISDAIEDFSGYPASDFIHNRVRSLIEITHPEDRGMVLKAINEGIEQKKPFILEYRIQQANEQIHWVYEKGQGVFRDNEIIWVDGAIFDITERKLADRKIQYMATHDMLTNLPNRTLFFDRMNHALAKAKRSKRPLAVFFIDLDNFKTINDTLGHASGDHVLISIAERLKDSLRESDTVARLSGDEFTILLENTTHEQYTKVMAKKLKSIISRPIKMKNDKKIIVTASIGICPNHEGDDADILLRKADSAMYIAKQKGKNTYQVYEPEIPI
jgi:diguanylate cyclase (GGDEF)-like protein/PAS domain S-box-containing protein